MSSQPRKWCGHFQWAHDLTGAFIIIPSKRKGLTICTNVAEYPTHLGTTLSSLIINFVNYGKRVNKVEHRLLNIYYVLLLRKDCFPAETSHHLRQQMKYTTGILSLMIQIARSALYYVQLAGG